MHREASLATLMRPTMSSFTSGKCSECERMVWTWLRSCDKCWAMWCPICWEGHKCEERERPYAPLRS